MDPLTPQQDSALLFLCEIIDPTGDLIVTLHQPPEKDIHFLTSSKALSLASPTIRGMLMRQPSPNNRLQYDEKLNFHKLILVQGHPEALRIFLDVSHHRPVSIPGSPISDTLQRLAFFVKHYECQNAFLGRAQLWIPEVLYTWDAEDLWKALEFAFVVNARDKFNNVSRALMLKGPDRFTRWKFAEGVENSWVLPWDITSTSPLSHLYV